MTPERWHQIEQICERALKRQVSERAAFLKEACGGDEALRQQVDRLLAHEQTAKSFLEAPALEMAAKAMAEEPDRALVGRQIGAYRITSLLGAGGMGEVYRAEDTRLARAVAMKVLPKELAQDQERMSRFVREARAASALNHANVAHIYEIGQSDGLHFIAMEYVEGQSLAQKMSGKPLDLAEILEVGIQVADALEEAHRKGITHRDIKSANLMKTPTGQVKVLDFGLAKITRREGEAAGSDVSTSIQTAPGRILGTLRYMSPEQVLGKELDARTDLFSLGVVLYEMTTGRQPFSGKQASEVMDRILHAQPEALARFNYEVPTELERVIRKCLEKDRERRYQLAREVQADLSRLKEGSAANAVMVDKSTAKARATLRHPVAVAAVMLMIVAAIAYALLFHRSPGLLSPEIKSLAVLPLENLSGDPLQEYFADGMTEALISNLAQIRALKVISRTSVMRYKASRRSLPEIAQELNVDAVITGSVQRSSGRVRVTAQLIQAATDVHLWARNYERELGDVLKLQSEVARAVVDEIRIQLTPEERARLASAHNIVPAAHEEYLLGSYYRWKQNEEDLERAVHHFERATQIDPNYAAAYAGLSNAWLERGIWGARSFTEVHSPSRVAATRALELDDRLAEGYVVQGHLKYVYDWDWTGAEKDLQHALELDPNNLDANRRYADLLQALGRFPESISHIERAEQLDPLSSNICSGFGRILYRARKYDEAILHLQRAIELEPRNYGAYGRLGDVYEQMGKYDLAIANVEKAQKFQSGGGNVGYPARLARVYARMGKRDQALRTLEKLKATTESSRLPLLQMAAADADLGAKDEAFDLLFRLVDERNNLSIYIKTDPPLDSLHSDPRWPKLLRRMNFPGE
jgi:serine/threonine protein kinase/Tfp pilus assembly protein PilF